MSKKVLSLLLTICMLVSLASPAFALVNAESSEYSVIYRYNQHRLSIMGGVTAHADKGAQNGNYWQPALENITSIWNTAVAHSANVLNPKAGVSQFTGPYDTDGAYDSVSTIANDFGTMPFAFIDHNQNATFGIGAGYGIASGAVSGGRSWYAMKIMVPQANAYAFRAHFYGISSNTDTVFMHLVKANEWPALQEKMHSNFLGTYTEADGLVGFFGGTNALSAGADHAYRSLYMMTNYWGTRVEGATVDLDAGEYVVVYSSTSGRPIYGGSLELLGVDAPQKGALTAAVTEAVEVSEGNAIEIPLSASITTGGVTTPVDLTDETVSAVRVDVAGDAFEAEYENGNLYVSAKEGAARGANGSATVYMVLNNEVTAWCEVPLEVGYSVTYRYNQHRLSIMGGVTAHADKGAQNGNYWQPALENITSIWNTTAAHSANVLNPKANSSQFVGPYDTDGEYNSLSSISNDFGTMPFAIIGGNADLAINAGYGIGAAKVSGARSWYAMKIIVPQTNTYVFRGHFYGVAQNTSTVYVELFRADEYSTDKVLKYADPGAKGHGGLVGFFSGTNALSAGADHGYRSLYTMTNYYPTTNRVEGKPVTLEAGEYVVVYSSGANNTPIFGGSLELLGTETPKNGHLIPNADALNADGEFVAYQGIDNAIDLEVGFTNYVGGDKLYAASDWASVSAKNVRVEVAENAPFTAEFVDGKLYVDVDENATEFGSAGSATVSMVLNDEVTAWCEVPIAIKATPNVAIEMNTGASIRMRAPQGIRFYGTIDTTTADFADVAEYGMVLVPTVGISDISELVIGATCGGYAVAKVQAKNLYRQTDTYNEFTTVLTNLSPSYYDMSVTARVYVKLKNGYVLYSDTYCQRSIREIAANGLQVSTKPSEIEVFNKIVNGEDIDHSKAQ